MHRSRDEVRLVDTRGIKRWICAKGWRQTHPLEDSRFIDSIGVQLRPFSGPACAPLQIAAHASASASISGRLRKILVATILALLRVLRSRGYLGGLNEGPAWSAPVAIEITIDAEVDGKQFKSRIKFEGTRDDILNGVRFIEENAHKLGLTPAQFVEATLMYLPTTGLFLDEAAKQIQIIAIIYALLRLGNGHTALEDQDVSATLTIRDTEITVAVGAA